MDQLPPESPAMFRAVVHTLLWIALLYDDSGIALAAWGLTFLVPVP